ncbi:MAG: hypothetical protein MJ001_06670, partial [Paludibacteraceae bacterium]|nr:hypothetical protein [Paludibacteraceae bacterium]
EGRGLKLFAFDEVACDRSVAPHRGTWIETRTCSRRFFRSIKCWFALLMGLKERFSLFSPIGKQP